MFTPGEDMWRTPTNVYRLPIDPAAVPEFVRAVLLPQVLEVVDRWFPLLTDAASALELLEHRTELVFTGK